MSWFPHGARIPRSRNTGETHFDAFARFSGIDSWNGCVSNFFDVARDSSLDFVQLGTQS